MKTYRLYITSTKNLHIDVQAKSLKDARDLGESDLDYLLGKYPHEFQPCPEHTVNHITTFKQ